MRNAFWFPQGYGAKERSKDSRTEHLRGRSDRCRQRQIRVSAQCVTPVRKRFFKRFEQLSRNSGVGRPEVKVPEPSVLVVEDEPLIRPDVVDTFERAGCTTIVAATAEEAVG